MLFSAFACIQPPNEGYTSPDGGTTLNHWYHDPITGECRELKYLGNGGNANNFQTKDHCESYCKQSNLDFFASLNFFTFFDSVRKFFIALLKSHIQLKTKQIFNPVYNNYLIFSKIAIIGIFIGISSKSIQYLFLVWLILSAIRIGFRHLKITWEKIPSSIFRKFHWLP